MKKKNVILIYVALCASFVVYSAILYRIPQRTKSIGEEALRGQLIYQNHNCQSCHQFYGLGGYLGPDLTNVMSASGKGELLVRTVVRQGVMQMPAFDLTDDELDDLISFLKAVDSTGRSDPKKMIIQHDGMISNK